MIYQRRQNTKKWQVLRKMWTNAVGLNKKVNLIYLNNFLPKLNGGPFMRWVAKLRNCFPSTQMTKQSKTDINGSREILWSYKNPQLSNQSCVRSSSSSLLVRLFHLSPPKGQRLNSEISWAASEPSGSMERQKEGNGPSKTLVHNFVCTGKRREKPSLPKIQPTAAPLCVTLGKQLLGCNLIGRGGTASCK